jgi:predicted unusual protein kinase regulating ubiquinone biosynthesis (AarF/ABC1/UbiB family)
VSDLQVGRLVLQVSHDAGTSGVRVPPELALLGKTLLHLDEIGRSLAPQFDPNAAIRRHAAEITSERMRRSASPSHVFAALTEFKEFVEQLPARANKILDLVANNEMRVKVETIDERLVIEGAQKIANRITLGLILAALIVGAALLMQIQTSFRILGYPALAMVCFLAAAAGGLMLILNILVQDRRTRRK